MAGKQVFLPSDARGATLIDEAPRFGALAELKDLANDSALYAKALQEMRDCATVHKSLIGDPGVISVQDNIETIKKIEKLSAELAELVDALNSTSESDLITGLWRCDKFEIEVRRRAPQSVPRKLRSATPAELREAAREALAMIAERPKSPGGKPSNKPADEADENVAKLILERLIKVLPGVEKDFLQEPDLFYNIADQVLDATRELDHKARWPMYRQLLQRLASASAEGLPPPS
jgi:hypothetical protein